VVQPCVDLYRERYRAHAASETPVFPGIRELLDNLSGRLPLVVATSKPRALAEPLIGVLWGIGSEEELRTAGADTLVQTPGELATFLASSRPASV
jgi:phosphoglycolate phosphatase-like HAD superfamily hydrolase